MTNLYFLFIIMTSLHAISSVEKKNTYVVKRVRDNELVITGKGSSSIWAKATPLEDFVYPWENDKPPLTRFQALHDTEWLYLLYTVTDPNVNVFVKTNDKSEVVFSDRVEIFFRRDEKMNPYYGLEIDPNARIMEYEATYHRKFDSSWSWPKGGLIAKGNVTADGYTVEVAISKKSLRQLGLINDHKIEAGIFRANCTLMTGTDENMKWVSWLKPDSPTADFHIPSAFGVLVLKE
ncbi:MAG: carbohydrate-binding family 9-like protein [Chryseolinea sp.]